jgi:beta-fructofuranosidase
MSLPREIWIRDGRLYQWPVREIEQLRSGRYDFSENAFSGDITYPQVSGRMADFEIEIMPADGEEMYRRFSIQVAQNESFHTTISFHPGDNILKIDRKYSGSRRAIIHQRRAQIQTEQGKLSLRVILDRYSMEVFVNGGRQVMTASIFTDLSADGILFSAIGSVRMKGVFYRLGRKKAAHDA